MARRSTVAIVVRAAASSAAAVSSVVPSTARNLHPYPPTVEIVPISPAHRIFRIPRVVELHERVRWRRARGLDEDFRDASKLGKQIFNLALAHIER